MITWQEMLTRLLIAALLGGLIGLERERKEWAAGLRTHMMVCVGACLIMIVSAFGFFDILNNDHIALDPSRIAAQVVSGIGFIGAGTIMFLKQGTIRGLTTASGLWTVAAIGLAAGSGLYFAAGITTAIALIILWALKPLETKYFKKFGHATLKIAMHFDVAHSVLIQKLMSNEHLKIQSFSLKKNDNAIELEAIVENMDSPKMNALIQEIKNDPAVKEVSWVK